MLHDKCDVVHVSNETAKSIPVEFKSVIVHLCVCLAWHVEETFERECGRLDYGRGPS